MRNSCTQTDTFGSFIKAMRRERELLASKICDAVGISVSYYSDIEKDRRYPPDREALAKMANALYLTESETAMFYDLAGKARSEAPPDLPEYINEYEVVRVALRLAKEKGCLGDWHRFIHDIESRAGR